MNFFGEIVLPVVLFMMMLGIGFGTKITAFKYLIYSPKATLIGVFSQIFLLPIIALVLGLFFSEEIAAGLFLLSLCPSGTGSNLITKMVSGNVELSIVLTTLSSFLSLILMPLGMQFVLSETIVNTQLINKFDLFTVVGQISLFVVLPVLIGTLIGEWNRAFVEKLKAMLKWLLPTLLFGVFFLIWIYDEPKSEHLSVGEFLLPVLLINLLSMLLSFLFSKLNKLSTKDALSISIESGLKNSGIGLLLVSSMSQGTFTLLMLAYSFTSFYVTLALGALLKRFG